MIKRYSTTLLTTLVAVGILAVSLLFVPSLANAGSGDSVCGGLNSAISGQDSTTNQNCDKANATKDLNSTIELALNMLSIIAGIISVIMMIIGGLKFITSEGDSAKVISARNSIIFSVVGFGIVALAQVIIKFAIKKASSA